MVIDFSNLPTYFLENFLILLQPEKLKKYNLFKGGRGSGKSRQIAMALIYYSFVIEGNILVLQRQYKDIREASFENLCNTITNLGLGDLFKITTSPFRITNKATKTNFIFRGLDDANKLKSIEDIQFVWIEEADQISEKNFQILQLSVRSYDDIKFFFSFNTTNPFSYLKREFFDKPRSDVYVHHSTYLDNYFLPQAFRQEMEFIKQTNPRRYAMDGLGEWASVEGLIYENFKIEDFDENIFSKVYFGLDFGWNDPTAFVKLAITSNKIYILDEFYSSHLTNQDLINILSTRKDIRGQIVYCDSSEPARIQELNKQIRGAKFLPVEKKKLTLLEQIKKIQEYEIVICPKCKNFQSEIYSYAWKTDKNGQPLDIPEDRNNHLMDAMRYALLDYFAPRVEIASTKQKILF